MKRLRIINGNPKYLETSFCGSYYVDCKIVGRSQNWYHIEYTDSNTDELEKVQISIDDVEKIDQHYNKYSETYKEDIFSFLNDVKCGDIPLDKAVEIMLNDGEIKL